MTIYLHGLEYRPTTAEKVIDDTLCDFGIKDFSAPFVERNTSQKLCVSRTGHGVQYDRFFIRNSLLSRYLHNSVRGTGRIPSPTMELVDELNTTSFCTEWVFYSNLEESCMLAMHRGKIKRVDNISLKVLEEIFQNNLEKFIILDQSLEVDNYIHGRLLTQIIKSQGIRCPYTAIIRALTTHFAQDG